MSRADSPGPIAVIGAAGHTGRFVVAELLRRGLTPIGIGRDREKLEDASPATECRLVTLDDPASIDRALAGAAAVINCAGPFLDTARPVIEAALRARIPYLDVTAEQASAQACFDQFDEAARKDGIVIVPAMGFYGGLADLLATATLDGRKVCGWMEVGIALDSWHPTRGTRLTGERNRTRRMRIAGGRLEPLPDPAPTRSWRFPEPFGAQDMVELPFGETILIARHLAVAELRTFLNLAPLKDLRDPATPPPVAEDESGRSGQTFLVEVVARNGAGERRTVARGRDIYAVTAPLVVEAALRILRDGGALRGALAPGQLPGAATFLQHLATHHLTFELG